MNLWGRLSRFVLLVFTSSHSDGVFAGYCFVHLGMVLPKVLTKQEPDTYGNISMDDVKKYGAVTT
jgi:hypothetical protein